MTRSRLTWLLPVGVSAVGLLATHALAYRLVAVDPVARRHVLEASGHGYLDGAAVGAFLVTLIALGFAGSVLAAVGGRSGARVPLRLFVLVPFCGFAVQEHLERTLHTGDLAVATALEPTFAVGLLLQIPFAMFGWIVARALTAVARVVAAVLRSCRDIPARATPPVRRFVCVRVPRIGLLAGGHGQRAPPSLALR